MSTRHQQHPFTKLVNRAILAVALLLLALLLLPLLALPSAAQETSPDGTLPDTFAEVVDVRVVNLEVVVEGEDGVRIPELRPEDFVLYVDGRETPVEFFTEVRDGHIDPGVESSPLPPALATLPAAVTTLPAAVEAEPRLARTSLAGTSLAGTSLAGTSLAGTSYLLFLDESSGTGWSRNRVLRSMVEQVDELGPADRVAIVAFGGRQLRLLSDWSHSVEDLKQVLDEARRRRPSLYRPLVDPAPASFVYRPYELENQFSESGVFDNGTKDKAPDIQRTVKRLQRVQLAVESAMRGFSSASGRKVMLLAAGDWPFSPAEAALASAGPTVGLGAFDGGESFWSSLYENANRFGFTLYPLDIGTPTVVFAFDGGDGAEDWGHAIRELENHTTLHVLAEETGGRAFVEGQALHALEEVMADTRSYYWLGFTPQWRQNDEYHDVRVEVSRPGSRTRHRSGFLDRSRSAENAALVQSAMITGRVPGARPLRVDFGAPSYSHRRVEVPLRIHIPGDDLIFLQQGDLYRSQLELRMLVLDSEGQHTELPVIPVRVAAQEQPAPGATTWYNTTLELRRSDHQVVVMLYDPVGGSLLSTVAQLDLAGVR